MSFHYKKLLRSVCLSMFTNKREMMKPLLVAFDFDHTIINDNTDLIVQKLLPADKITDDLKKLYKEDGWTAFMQKIFILLHESGITPTQIRDAIVRIPATPGMNNLLRTLEQFQVEVIIISDSNSVFIKDWLTESSLKNVVAQVFTNPAHYDEDGCLKIEMYHLQNWCQFSTRNLCKGHILESYVEKRRNEGIDFSHLAFVGDGKYDLCPSLRLSENDLVFAREDFHLDKLIKEMQNQKDESVKATVHSWKSGDDILKVVSDYFN
ncbi:probable phosphatase phospho2 isoform X2 [Periplaneta americana]|uniref:probable phosphatase phospho2 isoform X2 n=1 Tax=Periplaneta americana TaxID=6978 RepID=UPI0037E90189